MTEHHDGPSTLDPELHHRVVADFPGEEHTAAVALERLAEAVTRHGGDAFAICSAVLDEAQGDLVRFEAALHDAEQSLGR